MGQHSKGFTLLELMIVLAMIAIMLTVTVKITGSAATDANRAMFCSNILILQDAVIQWSQHQGHAPTVDEINNIIIPTYIGTLTNPWKSAPLIIQPWSDTSTCGQYGQVMYDPTSMRWWYCPGCN